MSKLNNNIPNYTGPFKELIPEFINYKRAQGYKYRGAIVYKLKEMDDFFKKRGVKNIVITRDLYEEFTSHRANENKNNIEKRRTAIREFAKYLSNLGYAKIYTGMDDNRIFKEQFIPYIFSEAEINKLFKTLKNDCLMNKNKESETFRLIILLYPKFAIILSHTIIANLHT